MTEITYEVREKDLIAFNEHQLLESERLQKTIRRHQATIPGILAFVSLVLWLAYQDTLSAIWVGVGAVAWGLLAPFYLQWSARRQIRAMYTAEDRASAIGKHTLRVERKDLVEVSGSGESRMPWAEVLRIESTKKYAFLYVDINSALVIPRATITSGDLHEFVKEADERIEEAS